jgi:tRNA(Arg) A34 adenosine deaminase TadA
MQEKSYVLVDTFDKLKDMVNHVKDKEIIAEGYNHIRNLNMENIFSIHAEMEAIKKLRQIVRTKDKQFINKCKLYVVRVGQKSMDYPFKLSSPCIHCAKAINSVGIQRICYSVSDDEFEEEAE